MSTVKTVPQLVMSSTKVQKQNSSCPTHFLHFARVTVSYTVMSNQLVQIPLLLIKSQKLYDVKSLLETHFGSNWEMVSNLKFYSQLRADQQDLLEQGDTPQPQEEEDDVREIATTVRIFWECNMLRLREN